MAKNGRRLPEKPDEEQELILNLDSHLLTKSRTNTAIYAIETVAVLL
jgi:hypothetical protein